MTLLKYVILYVEDNYLTRNHVAAELKKKFETVYTADNGKDALELYKMHKPDLILTDVKMPIMSGEKLINEIRFVHNDYTTPIIVISSYEKEFFRIEEMKINKFIIKPVTTLSIIYNIFEVLKIPY